MEEGHQAGLVFNMDEPDLLWKMPNMTYISHQETHVPGLKAAKDQLTLLFSGNAAGFMIESGLIYKAANTCALMDKDKNPAACLPDG